MHTLAIVDDDCEILDVFKRFFSAKENIRVMTYSEPQTALESLAKNPVDLILLDIMMPKLDGLDFLKKLKERHIRSKVIMVTAHSTLDRILVSHKFDAADFVTKPVNLNELYNKIENILSKPS
ncbi:MAG: response regulator [Gammaproteobacteria bacterium]|nr:response regulator [Gammaproteobacteria bacterium]